MSKGTNTFVCICGYCCIKPFCKTSLDSDAAMNVVMSEYIVDVV